MKIIDLLNKIANGDEPPKKIYYKNEIFEYDEKEKDYVHIDFTEYLFDVYLITEILNDEVEILETTITYKPDKIEKLDLEEINKNISLGVKNDIYLAIKINEIIDKVNSL